MGFAEEQVQFTGMLVLYNNVLQSLYRSQILTLGVVFGAILVMFWILFRSLTLALIALAPNLLAAGLVLGVMGLLGIPLDIMTITIAAIVVGIGVDDCIHYVHRYMMEFPKDRDYRATMHRCHSSIGRVATTADGCAISTVLFRLTRKALHVENKVEHGNAGHQYRAHATLGLGIRFSSQPNMVTMTPVSKT